MHDENENESVGAERRAAVGTDEGEVRTDLDLGAVLRVLDHPRRRYLVTTLVNGRSEAPLAELATEIAARERDKPVTDVTPRERASVHTSLHHSHVPRLVDLGIVTYDADDESVVSATNADRVRSVLHSAGVALTTESDESHTEDRPAPSDGE
ncbi:DUF7344 domain-containing protein [Salinirubrum litoreum]|uniref:DUF7344 domain-containing protein n=1 Tax=Salinirubrum litoreum TaxID=1126234 RepID=A0ABD5REM1_9EURY|nr:hypothetical protein [Salinirubrum litoreum]